MGHRKRADWDARFLSRLVPQSNGCLFYDGPALGDGRYGCIWTGSPERAHRYAWRREKGPIPYGLRVLHRCDNPRCCNIEHLFLGTNDDNMKDMIQKGRSLTGTKNPAAKLTDDEVQAIRADGRALRVIAADYGIGKSMVHLIRTGQKWKHLRSNLSDNARGQGAPR